MATDLRDELARMAGDAGSGPAPDDLWRRGVRRRRRARVVTALGTAAAVVLVVAAGAVGRDLLERPTAQPAEGADSAAIPSKLVTPGRWLGGTTDDPPGRLAVLAGAERADGWWGTTDGVVGISAETGAYRFLDLPDAFDDPAADFLGDGHPALSPHGRQVAYWTRDPQRASWVGGVAVYDTVTGEVLRHELPSDLGLAPELLEWGGDDELVVGYGVVTDRRDDGWSSSSRAPVVWRPATDEVVELSTQIGSPDGVSPTEDGFAVVRSRRLELRSGPSAELDRVVRLAGRRDAVEITVDPTASTLVMLPPGDRAGGVVRRLLVGTVGENRVRLEPQPVEMEVFGLLGWQDAQHVVVRGIVPGTQRSRAGAYAVDLRTGNPRLVVREDRDGTGMFPVYAGALWPVRTADRPEPVAHDPRLPAAGGAVVVIAALGALAVMKRRRRAG